MKRLNILFGTIQVRSGKETKNIEQAVWIEGQSEYKTQKKVFKEPATITRVVSSKIIGKTNY